MFDRLNMTFDIDVCAPEGGVPWIPSRQVFSVDDDGLNQKWSGRVWMNPPYSNPGPWVRRFINHAWGVALIPTGNGIWFDELWYSGARFVLGPKYFKFVNGTGSGLPTRVWFVAFGTDCCEAVGRLEDQPTPGNPPPLGSPSR